MDKKNREIEIAQIINLINKHLEGRDFNTVINVLNNILIVQLINASPDHNPLPWIKNLCDKMYNHIEEIYKDKFPNSEDKEK